MLSPLEEIKNRIDLTDYLRPYVANLAPSGKSLKGLCPFHKEKTPSFFISPDKQVWYCFGCQKGGDLMKFVMEMEKMEFSEALRFLADKAGVVLEKQDPKLLSLKNKVFEVLKQSDRFFRFHLTKNKPAQDYLLNRGLKTETLNYFGLGFAPQGWKNLYDFLKKNGFNDSEIESAGMIIRSNNPKFGGYYDRFRSRIIFPIFDQQSRVIGFSGRILPLDFARDKPQENQNQAEDSQTGEAKYINTPETIVYQKGRVLYGFSQTQESVRGKEQAVLVEGNLDVLMGWQEGLKNIVAVSGTGLTEFQLKLLSRFCKELVLSFDMDKAGEQATDRSIGLASQLGFEIKVLNMPEGKDLADFAKAFPEKITDLASTASNVMNYYFDKIFSGAPDSLESRKKALAYLLPRIKFLKNPVEQNEWLKNLSSRIKIPEKMVFEEFSKTRSLLETNPDFDETNAEIGSNIFIKSRWERLAEKILGLAVRFPELSLKLVGFTDYFPYRLKETAELLRRGLLEKTESFDKETLNYLYLLGDYETSLLPPKFSPEQEMDRSLFELKKLNLRSKINEISLAMKEAEIMGNQERSETLAKEINKILKELGNLDASEESR